MYVMGVAAACTTLAGVVGGCAASGSKSPKPLAKANLAKENELLGRVKSLEGEWELQDKLTPHDRIIFKTSSAGSAVREIMFPGKGHEMTNMYHMDGDSLVVTHYCAGGNQPRMRATGVDGNTINFRYDSVTNYHENAEGFMGGVSLVFVDPTHIKQVWTTYKDGKASEPMVFDLVKVK